MTTRASIAGHPVHAMLVVVPATFIVTTAALDLFASRTDGRDARKLSEAAHWTNRAVLASGALAGLFGAADWTGLREGSQERGIGLLHGLGNAAVLGLFGLALATRDDRPTTGPTAALTAAGAMLAVGTAWLGGELVYRHGVGIDEGHVPLLGDGR